MLVRTTQPVRVLVRKVNRGTVTSIPVPLAGSGDAGGADTPRGHCTAVPAGAGGLVPASPDAGTPTARYATTTAAVAAYAPG